ncbi:MAG TPA: FKBP-type peptidyl-prolyl cis-trans isomerase [Fimbriimonadaceae bacterium]|nr:FKBP-type peptidyl-prolyl cis-trans isomerase [Fimbriimonadaceae bacterium]
MPIQAIALFAALLVQGQGTLQSTDTVIGAGREAQAKDIVTVEYTGTLSDGKVFDSSKDHGPIAFVLGEGHVIKGWDQGILGMKVGGKRHLVIPPDLGYGDQAVGGGLIPAKSTLTFDVELLRVDRAGDPLKIDLKTTGAGKGDAAKPGDEVVLNWKGAFLDGFEFVNTYTAKQPTTIFLERPGLPAGFNQALAGIKPGEKRHAVIPYNLAYGPDGLHNTAVGPYSTLVLDIEAVQVTPAAQAFERDKKKLKIEEEAPGSGPAVKTGDHVLIQFTVTLEDGKKIFSTSDAGQPAPYDVGSARVTRGFDVGIVGMKAGGKRKLTMPPDLAFGATGTQNGIPPNATLIIDVEVVKINP